jgi:hypothetical protein
MTSNIIIPATTAAVTTDRHNVYANNLPVSIAVTGLSAGEYVQVEFSADNGSTWEDLYIAGAQVTISSINKVRALYSPLIIRLVKSTTLQPVSAAIYQNNLEGTF